MAAVVTERHESQPDRFIGLVLRRPSPILTWRPALEARAERERVAAANPEEVSGAMLLEDESVVRLSRAPTRKMIAWPVMARVRRETPHEEKRRALVRGAFAAVAVVGLLLGCAVGVKVWDSCGVARSEALPSRVLAAHVLDERVDTLARVAAPATPVPVAASPAAPTPAKAPAAATHRGRAHHGPRATASTTHR